MVIRSNTVFSILELCIFHLQSAVVSILIMKTKKQFKTVLFSAISPIETFFLFFLFIYLFIFFFSFFSEK